MWVKYVIHYGGFIGCEDECEVCVGDDATQEEIEQAIQDDYEEKLIENCYWERVDEEDE